MSLDPYAKLPPQEETPERVDDPRSNAVHSSLVFAVLAAVLAGLFPLLGLPWAQLATRAFGKYHSLHLSMAAVVALAVIQWTSGTLLFVWVRRKLPGVPLGLAAPCAVVAYAFLTLLLLRPFGLYSYWDLWH